MCATLNQGGVLRCDSKADRVFWFDQVFGHGLLVVSVNFVLLLVIVSGCSGLH